MTKTAEQLKALDVPLIRPTILVADDEDEVRGLVRQILEPQFLVRDARNGKEVLQEMDRAPIDLVILDLVMPEVEGIETLQALRGRCPDVPVLVMSGAFGGSFLHCAKLLGAHAALKKPFTCDALLERVCALLEAA
jgi:DNA-binding response OmpR family regulator